MILLIVMHLYHFVKGTGLAKIDMEFEYLSMYDLYLLKVLSRDMVNTPGNSRMLSRNSKKRCPVIYSPRYTMDAKKLT